MELCKLIASKIFVVKPFLTLFSSQKIITFPEKDAV